MATWPAELPQSQFVGLTDIKVSGVLRTQTDIGPVKTRRRFTATPYNVSTPIVLDNDQRTTYEGFYDGTLGDGALPFDWTDPISDSVMQFRFRAPTQFRLMRGDPNRTKRHWIGTMQLEILP